MGRDPEPDRVSVFSEADFLLSNVSSQMATVAIGCQSHSWVGNGFTNGVFLESSSGKMLFMLRHSYLYEDLFVIGRMKMDEALVDKWIILCN